MMNAFILSTVLHLVTPQGTSIELSFFDEQGAVVPVVDAEIVLVGWSRVIPISLDPGNDTLAVPMDQAWACAEAPDHCGGSVDQAMLVVNLADGSRIHSTGLTFADDRGHGAIEFSNGDRFEIATGSRSQARRFLSPWEDRTLTVIDENGAPVEGLAVEVSEHLSSQNHCGFPSGAHLYRTVTDRQGTFSLPRGDFELALAFHLDAAVLAAPVGVHRNRLVGRAADLPDPVVVRRYQRKPLRIEVQESAHRNRAVSLVGCVTQCSCGACCGTLGRTDDVGVIRVEAFSAEEYERLELMDPASSESLMRLDPQDLEESSHRWISVHIDPSPRD